jgi:VWFA-related protein
MIRPVVAGLVLLALQAAGSPQRPTFSAKVESVRVDVLATRDRRPLTGLTKADFEVRDNGVLQTIDYAAFEDIPLNVVLTLDGSGSVRGERIQHLRAASRNLLDQLRPAEQAALVTFGDAVVMHSALTHDKGAVRKALDEPLPLGDTALVDAAYAGILTGESQPGRALVLVFSDGVEVSSYLRADAVLDIAKRSDSVVYGVSLQNVSRPKFLQDLTEASGGDILEIKSTTDIDAAFKAILDQFRHRYLLSYTPRGVDRSGWHRLEVRVKQRGVTVKARPGYTRG